MGRRKTVLFRTNDRVVVRGRLATVSHVLHEGAVVLRYDGDDQTRVVPADRVELVGDDYSSSAGSSMQS